MARPRDLDMRFGHILLTSFHRRPNTRGTSGNGARLAENWLHDQWRLFAELTVPSVAAQSETDFTWVVRCRPDSPDWFRALTDTVRIGPAVHFSFSPNDPILGRLADGPADALLVTRTHPAGALHRRAVERIREDCEADPYTSEAVTLTDGYLLDRAARRMRPYHNLRAPLCTTISLQPARGDLSRSGRHGRAPRGLPARSISEGEPMFALAGPEKRHPGRPGKPLDGRWLAARATTEILDRDFGLALAGDAGRAAVWPGHGPRARPASKPGWLPSPAAARRQKVVVSMPCFQAWGSLARAVDSVLDQTHGDLLVIVANDGDDDPRWDVLGHIRDPRLVRVDYQASRGRYFADQIALMARLGQYLLIHGADEWSEPDRVQALLEEMRRGHGIAAVSAHYQHRAGSGRPAVVGPVLAPVPVTPLYSGGPGRAARPAYQALFDAPGLLAVGGCYGGHRLEYDNFLLHVLRMTGAVIPVDRPLYHEADRSAAPRPGDPAYTDPQARMSAAAAWTRLYAEAYHLYCEYLQGSVGYSVLCRHLRSLAWRYVSTSDWGLLRVEVSRLRWHAATGRDRDHSAARAAPRPARVPAGGRLLAAHTVPAGSLAAGSPSAGTVLAGAISTPTHPALPVITGILTARSQADLGPDAITHPLLPHDATVMLERTGADFVLIEAAAMLPGSAWAYAANPAAADRGRRLADLVDAAHADGKPVVFLRNLPRHRMPGLGWLDAMCDAVVHGGLGVQLARFNPIGLPTRRPSGPLYMAARDPREPAGQRRLLDQLTGGKRPAVRVADVPWRELPDAYRRHAVFLAASADQALQQRACAARVIAPLGSDGAAGTLAAVDAAAVIAQLDAARAAGVPPMTEVRQVLREIFDADATPVRLVTIAGLAGLPAGIPASRQIAVLATVRDAAEARTTAHQLLRQRLRPAEVVVASGSTGPGAAAQGLADAIGQALTGLADAGITIRIACGESEQNAARRAHLPWIARWDSRAGPSEWYLLDLVCARECSRADVIGRSPGADYVFADTAEPALVRADLLGPGWPLPQSWSRRGIRMLSITC